MTHLYLLAITTCISCLGIDWPLIHKNYDYPYFQLNNKTFDIKYFVANDSLSVDKIDFNDQFIIVNTSNFKNINGMKSEIFNYASNHLYTGVVMINPDVFMSMNDLKDWINKNDEDNKNNHELQNKNVFTNYVGIDPFVNEQPSVYIDYFFINIKSSPIVIMCQNNYPLHNLLTNIRKIDPKRYIYILNPNTDHQASDISYDDNMMLINVPDRGDNDVINDLFKIHSKLIFIYDDSLISNDFFYYMNHFEPLLDVDPTVMCVSALNNNGLINRVHSSTRVYRSHHFAKNGWMVNNQTWTSIRHQWHNYINGGIDSYGRQCLYPEISRVVQNSSQFLALNSEIILWGRNQKLTQLLYNRYIEWYKIDIINSKSIQDSSFDLLDKYDLRNDGKLNSFYFADNSAVIPTWYQNEYVYLVVNAEVSCYYLNLPESINRRKYMESHVKNLNLPLHINLCQRSEGVRFSKSSNSPSLMRNGQLGCWKAHQNAWKSSKTRWTLVMEDDAVIDPSCDFTLPDDNYNYYHMDVRTGLHGAYGYYIRDDISKDYSLIDPEYIGDMPVDFYILSTHLHLLSENAPQPRSRVKKCERVCIGYDDNLFPSDRLHIDTHH
jgi:hypothetical protein